MKREVYQDKENNKTIMSQNLIKLVSQGMEISQISINDIVENCSISRSNFYNYFDDIYDLLEWTYVQELTPQFMEMFELGLHREAFKYMYYKIYNDRNFYLSIYTSNKDKSVDKYVEKLILDIFMSQKFDEVSHSHENRWYGTALSGKAVASMHGFIIREWISTNFVMDVEDIIDFSIFIRNANLHDVLKGTSK